MRRLALVAATLVALVAASPAAASTSSRSQALVADAVELGVTFWAERNVTACPTPTVTIVEAPAGVAAAAGSSVRGSCSIELGRELVRDAGRERWSRYGTDGDRLELFVVVAHELGHANGLEHAEGLMAEDVLTRLAHGDLSVAPAAARAHVKRLERLERRAAQAKRKARR